MFVHSCRRYRAENEETCCKESRLPETLANWKLVYKHRLWLMARTALRDFYFAIEKMVKLEIGPPYLLGINEQVTKTQRRNI